MPTSGGQYRWFWRLLRGMWSDVAAPSRVAMFRARPPHWQRTAIKGGIVGGQSQRPPDGVPSRNETEGFAIRTKKNMDFIVAAHDSGEDVHVVTQLVLSLLGMVVFPFERLHGFLWHETLTDLETGVGRRGPTTVGGTFPVRLVSSSAYCAMRLPTEMSLLGRQSLLDRAHDLVH